MYNYNEMKPQIFTEEGQVTFLKIRDNVHKILKVSGAVRMEEAIRESHGDIWFRIACVDRLVELGEIREVTMNNEAGQHRIFVSNRG